MLTNSYHRVRPNFHLMVTPDTEHKPLIPFAPATEEYCYKFPSCADSMKHAKQLHPDHEIAVRDFDIVFRTSDRDAFCQLWMENFCNDHAVPSATAYVAYLRSQGTADDIYQFTDKTVYGARDNFIRVLPYPTETSGRSLQETNSTGCQLYFTEEECNNAEISCEWRGQFDSCHSPGNYSVIIQPTSSPSPAPTSAPTAINAGGMRGTPNGATASNSGSTGPSRRQRIGIIVGVTVGTVALLTIAFIFRRHRRSSMNGPSSITIHSANEDGTPIIDWNEGAMTREDEAQQVSNVPELASQTQQSNSVASTPRSCDVYIEDDGVETQIDIHHGRYASI